jgi:hypothetical protein
MKTAARVVSLVGAAAALEIPEKGVGHPHTDLWMHQPSVYRGRARA